VVYIQGVAPHMGAMAPSDDDDLAERGIVQQLLGLRRLKPYLWPKGNIGFKLRT